VRGVGTHFINFEREGDMGIISKEKVKEQVDQALIKGFEIKPEQLQSSATVFGDLGLDSIDAVDLLVMLEDSLHVRVDPEEFSKIRTLQDTYDYVEKLVSASNRPPQEASP